MFTYNITEKLVSPTHSFVDEFVPDLRFNIFKKIIEFFSDDFFIAVFKFRNSFFQHFFQTFHPSSEYLKNAWVSVMSLCVGQDMNRVASGLLE